MKKLLNEILKIILQVTPKDCVFSTSPHLRPPNLGSKLGGGGEGKKNQNAKIGQNRNHIFPPKIMKGEANF